MIVLHGVEIVVLGVFTGFVTTSPTARTWVTPGSWSTGRRDVAAGRVAWVVWGVGQVPRSSRTVVGVVRIHWTVSTARHGLSVGLC